MAEERDFERLRELTPQQLQMELAAAYLALAAAYQAIAAQEVEIRGLRGSLAELWNEGEQYMAEGRIDHLTGALNRAGVKNTLKAEMNFSARTGFPLCVIAIDVDDFKGVNDTFGHAAGDTVLREIVQRFREVLRPYDVIARMGGDEMLVVLRKTDLRNAVAVVAERLREAVAGVPFCYNSFTPSVTVSIGVAEIQEDEPSDKLLEAADEALYEAKRSGRNRVVGNKR